MTWRPARFRGCACRSRAARRATLARHRDRHEPARARPSRWVGPGQVKAEAARAVLQDGSGASSTRAKPSWPSPACEPPVRSEPARAGGLLRAGCHRRSSGTGVETPRPPGSSVSLRQSVTCRVSGAFDPCRSSRRSRASPLRFGTSGRGHPPAPSEPRCATCPPPATWPETDSGQGGSPGSRTGATGRSSGGTPTGKTRRRRTSRRPG